MYASIGVRVERPYRCSRFKVHVQGSRANSNSNRSDGSCGSREHVRAGRGGGHWDALGKECPSRAHARRIIFSKAAVDLPRSRIRR